MPSLAVVAEQLSRRDFDLSGAQILVLSFSAVITVICVTVHYEAMSWSSRLIHGLHLRRRARIVGLIFLLLVAHVIEVWIFAFAYWTLDGWESFGGLLGPFEEGALDFVYFSVTTFTTVGFGDIVPVGPVRILCGTEALVGLGLITWSASLAFLEMQLDWAEFRRPFRDRSSRATRGRPSRGRDGA